KNRKNDIVTLPKNIVDSFLDLKIYEYPNDYYIFSKNFIPGPDQTSSKQFRDKWLSIRKALKFPVSYQFYSLKDTGITNLMGILKDTRQVRDQARHSSIAITDIYTPHNSMVGNENIKKLDLSFE
ncbi:MAG TPA: integrase, partial [Flavobacterium sp.]|nr:integrase [Flavobacterium sp.]